MIVTCPECAARFLVDPAAIGAEGRMVRCGKCAHTWVEPAPEDFEEVMAAAAAAAPPDEAMAAPADEAMAAPPVDEPAFADPPPLGRRAEHGPRQRRRKSNVPALRREPSRWAARVAWLALIVVVVGIAAGSLVYRPQIVETWPAAERLYAAVGLPKEPPGFGLSLVNVKFDQQTKGGATVLLVEGEIENVSEKERVVPGLRATLIGKNKRELQNWTFSAPVPKLLPGENVKFQTSVKDPAEGAVRLTIVFYAPHTNGP